jgi:HEAT repeat protein
MRSIIVYLGVLLGLTAIATSLRADTEPTQSEDAKIDGKKLDQWIADMSSLDPGVREAAIQILPHFGKAARKGVKKLIVELGDNDASIRVNAVIALGIIGMEKEDLERGVKALGRLVENDPQAIVRLQAAASLASLGHAAKSAIPQLNSAVKSQLYNSWAVRRAAAIALRTVAMDPEEGPDPSAIQALVAGLKDNCGKVRFEILMSLITLGMPKSEKDKGVLEYEKSAVKNFLKDRDKALTIWARVLLMRIDQVSEKDVIVIGNMLKDRELHVRINAIQALGIIGPHAKSQVDGLIAALKEKNEGAIVLAAITSLGQMGGEASKALPELEKLAEENKNEQLKAMCKAAIDQINMKGVKPKAPAAKKVVP